MTDNEIIKALELCIEGGDGSCTICPYANTPNCYVESGKDILDLINRQKAEIERLTAHIQEGIDLAKQIPEMVATAQAEAIKEFAEALNEKLYSFPTVYNSAFRKMVDNLVKEMTEKGR